MTLAQLKGEAEPGVVRTDHYGADSGWQQLSSFSHTLRTGSRQRTHNIHARGINPDGQP